jgi:hypothetical protein
MVLEVIHEFCYSTKMNLLMQTQVIRTGFGSELFRQLIPLLVAVLPSTQCLLSLNKMPVLFVMNCKAKKIVKVKVTSFILHTAY